MRIVQTLLLALFFPLLLSAQSILEKEVDFSVSGLTVEQSIQKLGSEADLNFSYSSVLFNFDDQSITRTYQSERIDFILDDLLSFHGIQYEVIDQQIALFQKRNEIQKFTISGYIMDRESGENLIAANIYAYSPGLSGTISNEAGFFSLTLPEGLHEIHFSYTGFETEIRSIKIDRNIRLNVQLQLSPDLSVVVVTGKHRLDIESEEGFQSDVERAVEKSESIPTIGGEIDVIKSLQLLPGVNASNEGTSGLVIRGGGQDQNLILLDDVPIYYPNHLFGVFSVFNYSTVKNVDLIKDGFPARYGGRLSSVVDVKTKDGNTNELDGEIGIGLISANFMLEGPINKNKTSFLLAARRSYLDLFMRPLTRKIKSDLGVTGYTDYSFYDFNGKISHRFSDKDQVQVGIFSGNDKYFDDETFDYTLDYPLSSMSQLYMKWKNIATHASWRHEFNKKLHSKLTISYSNYQLDYDDQNIIAEYEPDSLTRLNIGMINYQSGVRDISGRIDFNLIPGPAHYIRFGFSATHHALTPGTNYLVQNEVYPANTIDTTFFASNFNSSELSAYIEDDFKLSDKVKVNLGIHASAFNTDGKLYSSIQPRLSLAAILHPKIVGKISFSTMTQYLHLLTNSGLGLPTDLWIPSTSVIKPQNSYQAVAGVTSNLGKEFSLSAEFYFKKMNNLIEYKNDSRFLIDTEDLDSRLTTGMGWSYGSEFMLSKTSGKTTGWASYTLSWSQRKFAEINDGEIFPYKYDRRHDISIALFHNINKNIEISGVWVYGTGNAISLPVGEYTLDPTQENTPVILYDYGERNNYRLPAYHRLDLGINFTKEMPWGEQVFGLSIYNSYNRQNPFFVNLTQKKDDPEIREFTQTTIFPIIPSVRYNVKF